MMKRVFAFALSLVLLLALLPQGALPVLAAARSGDCGPNLTWSFQDGKLSIRGSGEMNEYEYQQMPWEDLKPEIRSLELEQGVTAISYNAFGGCKALREVSLPEGLKSLGSRAFAYCVSLEQIKLPGSLTEFNRDAFFGCTALQEIEIPEGTTSLSGTFAYCSALRRVKLPQSLTHINTGTFSDSGLEQVELPEHLAYIDWLAFAGCEKLQSLRIPGTVKTIVTDAFRSCYRLSALRLEDGVEKVMERAFCGANNLRYVVIPPSVTEILYHAFGYAFDKETQEETLMPDFVIYGVAGTEAQRYAEENGIKFVAVKEIVNFSDVPMNAYYAKAVDWAVYHDPVVTKGVGDGAFGPEQPCTRGQVVTFLWRAAGKPEPKSSVNPFNDVAEGAFYYKAVLWAVEQGITRGLTDTSFGPGQTCTRGQVVTFLWRSQGKPAASGAQPAFTDVSEKAYYYRAMCWAVGAGVTKGVTDTSFAPDNNCTRGQVVTFLYRAAA